MSLGCSSLSLINYCTMSSNAISRLSKGQKGLLENAVLLWPFAKLSHSPWCGCLVMVKYKKKIKWAKDNMFRASNNNKAHSKKMNMQICMFFNWLPMCELNLLNLCCDHLSNPDR